MAARGGRSGAGGPFAGAPSLLVLMLAVLGVAAGVSGCASLQVSDRLRQDLDAGRLDPHHVVFICHGMLKDLGSPWSRRLRTELVEDGVVGLPVTYWSDPTGVWFNWGSVAPGRLVAETADALVRAHAESGSRRELIIDAVGFSNGGEVVLRAASYLEEARFRRVILFGSSSFAFSRQPGQLIDDGKIVELCNYWSPIDLTTILAPFGAGQFGLRAGDDRVTNEMKFMPHLPLFINARRRAAIRAHLLDDTERFPEASAFSRAVARLLE